MTAAALHGPDAATVTLPDRGRAGKKRPPLRGGQV
jgi:hypothetical protein